MRRLQCALLAAVAAIGFATIASAADMPVKARPMVTPAYNWTGFYIGGNGGYAGRGNRAVTFAANDPFAALTFCQGVLGTTCPAANDLKGGFGGIQVGYNRQLSQTWLLGIEADFNVSRIRGTGTGASFQAPAGTNAQFVEEQNIKWFGTIRPRLGFLPTESLLVYATGGFAYARVDESAVYNSDITFGAGPLGGFGALCFPANGSFPTCYRGASSRTAFGWTAGGGFELAAWGNVSVKAEYLYVGLPGRSVTVTAIAPAPGGGPASFTANFARADFQLVRLGLNYRF